MTKSGSAIGSINALDSHISLISKIERNINPITEVNKALSSSEQISKAAANLFPLEGALAAIEQANKLATSATAFSAINSMSTMNSIAEVMQRLDQFSKTSDKIRFLSEASMPRADIARTLGIRYQHVRNVLEADAAKSEAKKNETGAEADPSSLPPPSSHPGLLRGKVGPGGRVVIPAPIREQLGLEEGTELVFTLEGDELRVASMTTHLKQIQEKVRNFLPQDVSLVDELIDERRREAGTN
jgi:AbrB family looped-hinge helix DNA binding protein